MDVGPTGAYTRALLSKAIQTQGQVLMDLMNVSKKVETAHAKPLTSVSSSGRVDITI